MKRTMVGILLFGIFGVSFARAQRGAAAAPAEPRQYLAEFRTLAEVTWPKNRAIHVACHGHSVPAGYFKTPEVRTLESYPHLLHVGLAQRFPHAVINVIVTAIGGENSEKGAERFERDVLNHKPDVVTIDYGLNDRGLGLERAGKAWRAMIELAQAKGVKVLLLTPTPDQGVDWRGAANPLQQHATQIRNLAAEYGVGLVDSLARFEGFVRDGGDVGAVMSQRNHPNAKGHRFVADALLEWFR
jgi:acyl-CoA thioesterase I